MAIHYIVPGTKRKELAQEIGRWLGTEFKYLGMPSCAYRIGCVTLDKEGYFTVESTADEEMVERLIEHIYDIGYESEDNETVEEKRVCLSLPESSLSESAEANLRAIVDAKGHLITKALGVSDLPIEHENGKVSFPWLKGDATPDEIQAFQKFVIALCEMARRQKRINAQEKEVENEKYAFRCFLLRLGFIGEQFKPTRKILLRNLVGSSAFKSGSKKEVDE